MNVAVELVKLGMDEMKENVTCARHIQLHFTRRQIAGWHVRVSVFHQWSTFDPT